MSRIIEKISDYFCRLHGWITSLMAAVFTRAVPANEYVPLLQFPPEMVLEIVDHLPIDDAIMLSLTCRSLYRIVSTPFTRDLTYDQQREVLLRMESFMGATHSFCSYCNRLHAYSQDGRTQNALNLHRTQCHAGSFTPLYTWTHAYFNFDYQIARLLVNHNRYGPGNGIALDHLSPPCGHARASIPRHISTHPRWHATVKARFINGMLVLKATHILEADILDAVRGIDRVANYPLCEHTIAMDGPRGFDYRHKDRAVRHIMWPPIHLLGGCDKCLTDWEFRTTRKWASDAGCITLNTYHMVGAAESHMDPKWLLLADRGRKLRVHQIMSACAEYPIRTVMQLWEESDQKSAEEETEKGEWFYDYGYYC